MILSPHQALMVAAALKAAMPTFEENHVDGGGENTDTDIVDMALLQDALAVAHANGQHVVMEPVHLSEGSITTRSKESQ